MIIDCILDRYHGDSYDPYDFLEDMKSYSKIFGGLGSDIVEEMESVISGETNSDKGIKRALKK